MTWVERVVIAQIWRRMKNLLTGYGTYLAGLGLILQGLLDLVNALAQGGDVPMDAFYRINEGFVVLFGRRAIANAVATMTAAKPGGN